jgi:hypothetical protein
MITKVAGFELGVHGPEGDVLDELPPHERAAATADAATSLATRVPTLRMKCSLSQTGLAVRALD